MAFDYNELLGRIIARFGSRRAFCQKIGYKEGRLSSRLTGATPLKLEEIRLFADALEIPDELIGFYFFTPKVR